MATQVSLCILIHDERKAGLKDTVFISHPIICFYFRIENFVSQMGIAFIENDIILGKLKFINIFLMHSLETNKTLRVLCF